MTKKFKEVKLARAYIYKMVIGKWLYYTHMGASRGVMVNKLDH